MPRMTLECFAYDVYTLEGMANSGVGRGRGASVKGTKLGKRPICKCATGLNSDQEAFHMVIIIIIC